MPPEIQIIKKRIPEKTDAPTDLSGFFMAVDKPGNQEAYRLDLARLVATFVGSQVGDSIVKFDHHTHIVTQAEAEGGNFTFEVPNVIAKNMGIHVYCNQLPLTLNKGYSIDLTSETSKQVTILKNNADETYFAIKAEWPIFVGYYYKVAVPGTPENPPEPLSMVTLDSVTHQSPDNPAEEYNSANDVKFILTFSNTGSASESLNLRLLLVHNGSGGIIAQNDITHAVPAGGNTYEIIYKGLGTTTESNTYTLYVQGDRTGNDSVTVPAKTASFSSYIMGGTRNTTTTIFTTAKVNNTGSVIGNRTVYFQLDSGTKYPMTARNLLPGTGEPLSWEFTGVSSAAHTITLYDSDGTTVLDTWEVPAIEDIIPPDTDVVITDALNTWTMDTSYTSGGVFKSVGAWAVSSDLSNLELGYKNILDSIRYYRTQMKILDVPNLASINQVVLRFLGINGYTVNAAEFSAIQFHVHNKDLRYVQNYNDYHYSYTDNNIVLSTEIITNSDLGLGETEYRVTLDGQYFEGITDGYKGLLIKLNESTCLNFMYLRLKQLQYIY